MSKLIRGLAAAVTGAAAAGSILAALSAPASADTTSPPPWDTFSPTDGATYNNYSNPPGYGSVGGLLFYNSAGQQITGGSITSSPIAAYVQGTASTGGKKVQLAIALPGASDPSGWADYSESSTATSFPIGTGAPSNLQTGEVYTGSTSDQSISSFLTEYSDSGDPDPGYYQVRLYTSGTGANGTEFNSADIYVDTTNDTWTLAYSYDAFSGGTASVPAPVGTSVSLSTMAASSVVAGTQVPLKATVTDADGSTPAGTVTFYDGSTAIGSPVTVSGGTASTTYTTLSSNEPTASFTATFTPATGINYSSSTSSPLSETVTAPVGTTTTLSANPSSPVTTGTSVTFTAKVSDSDSSTPTGTVTFNDGSSVLQSDVALTDVSGTYEATYTTSSLSVTTHSLNAVYNAPLGYATSTGDLSFTVTPSGDATNTALAVSPAQEVAVGASETVTATVSDTANASQVPTGSVQFEVNGTDVGTPVPANGQGVATTTLTASVTAPWTAQPFTANSVADDEITAVFTPSGSAFQPSTSGSVEVFVSSTGYGDDTNANDGGNITTTAAPGTLTISTPWTSTNPFQLGSLTLQHGATEYEATAPFGTTSSTTSLTGNGGVLVADTGTGNQTWTASASVTDFTNTNGGSGLANVINGQNLEFTDAAVGAISGNAYQPTSTGPGTIQITADNVTDAPAGSGVPYGYNAPGSDGLSNGLHGTTGTAVQHTIATSGAAGAGSVYIDGTLTLFAPTSINPGTYTATLTFTAV